MYLEKVLDQPPPAAEQLLRELGNGENGFTGTSFGTGQATLEACLQSLQRYEDPRNLSPGFVQQTVFWMMNDQQQAVGMMRVRHALNDHLLLNGGHVGYYVRLSERGKGYATAALAMAVQFLKSKGVDRVLVTTEPNNELSSRVVLANGGVQDAPGVNPDTGETTMRYWIQS